MDFMSIESFPLGWFDLLALALLVTGAMLGRKHGMSEELLPSIRWLTIVPVAAIFYKPLGKALSTFGNFSLLAAYLGAYFACALGVFVCFSILKRVIGGKPISSERFGKSEYYLGICAGTVRVGCMMIVVLAFLNARGFSQEELRRRQAYVQDVYGSDFFPSLETVQSFVFQRSFVGGSLKHYAGSLLIKSTIPKDKNFHQQQWELGMTS